MNNIICEAVLSINNKVKLNVHWYLMVKDKIEDIGILVLWKTSALSSNFGVQEKKIDS